MIFFISKIFVCFLLICQISFANLADCPAKQPLIENVQQITCATKDLRTAVQQDNLLRTLSNTNFFADIHANDKVRSEESLSLFSQSLTKKIAETHKEYQEKGQDRYTLSIASYPAKAKKNSCPNKKTIDFDSSAGSALTDEEKEDALFDAMDDEDPFDAMEKEDALFDAMEAEGKGDLIDTIGGEEEDKPPLANYTPLPNKEVRNFQVRKYKGKAMICENTKKPVKERLALYCGKKSSKKKRGGGRTDKLVIDKRCKKDLTPSCAFLDSKGAKKPSPSNCVTGEDFADLTKNLIIKNTALEMNYCPPNCSYYTQTVQAIYKNKGANYCTDSYLIVHCGPKRQSGRYNLNIREINDLCRDFESCNYL